MTVAFALPAVTGQHRNRALAAARRAEAVRLRTQGLAYEEIATRLGYASRGTVYRIVSQAVRADVAEAAEELRQLELARLDALQEALWDAAMSGDVKACETVARVIRDRCQLLGLAAGSPPSPAERTVVDAAGG
ncbi:helix-turn-helix domain-containing protein [Flexivirga lutea]